MLNSYNEELFIILIFIVVSNSSGKDKLEDLIEKGRIKTNQVEPRSVVKERWLKENNTENFEEIENQKLIGKCYDLGGEPWKEDPRVCCAGAGKCTSDGQTFCGKPNCADAPGGADACCPSKIIRPCAMPPCRLDDTECSGGNFKQFQCTHAKSHCTRPICAGNRCIPHSWRNDGEVDCSDGSDEDCLTYGKYCNGEDNIIKKYFQNPNISSSDECSRACMENHKCKFWHYYVGQFIGQGEECRLFTACNDIREDPDNLMGNKHCPGEKIDCAWIGYYCDIDDHPPINKRSGTRAFDWKECGELCRENPECNVWHYFIRGKTCFLHNRCGDNIFAWKISETYDNISGSKYCPDKGNIKNECPVQKLNQGGCTSGAPCAPGSCIDESTCLNANGVKCNANMSRRSLADL